MRDDQSLMNAMMKGAMAGLAGGAALLLAERVEKQAILPEGSSSAGTAEAAVSAIAKERGVELSQPAAMAAGAGAQLAYCALWGAAYGALHHELEMPALLDGLLLAGAAYAAARAKGGVLPRLGVAAPATEQNMEQAAVDIGAHLAFGLTTASVFEAAA